MKMMRITPMLPVKQVEASLQFYQKLGFQVERFQKEWGWGMLRWDDCRLMLDQSINAHPAAPRQSVIYLYPDNIAEYHASVRRAGLAIPDLETTFYGHTEFRLEDPDGNRLWIGQSQG